MKKAIDKKFKNCYYIVVEADGRRSRLLGLISRGFLERNQGPPLGGKMDGLTQGCFIVCLVSLVLAVVTGLLQVWLPGAEKWKGTAWKLYETSGIFGMASIILLGVLMFLKK